MTTARTGTARTGTARTGTARTGTARTGAARRLRYSGSAEAPALVGPSVEVGPGVEFGSGVEVGSARPRFELGPSERGSGTVLSLAIVLAVATLLVAAVLYGAVVLATHRARSTADLAALTASTRVLDGTSTAAACAQAERVARANGGRILVCRAGAGAQGTVEAAVSVELPEALRRFGPAYAVARAGPRS